MIQRWNEEAVGLHGGSYKTWNNHPTRGGPDVACNCPERVIDFESYIGYPLKASLTMKCAIPCLMLAVLFGCKERDDVGPVKPAADAGTQTLNGQYDFEKGLADAVKAQGQVNEAEVQRILDRLYQTYATARTIELRGESRSNDKEVYGDTLPEETFRFELLAIGRDRYRLSAWKTQEGVAELLAVSWTEPTDGQQMIYEAGSPARPSRDVHDAYTTAMGSAGTENQLIIGAVVPPPYLATLDPAYAATMTESAALNHIVKEARVAGREEIDGVPCVRVDGVYLTSFGVSLWIGEADSLLHKYEVRSQSSSSPIASITTVTCATLLNPPLTPESLDFTPPSP